MTNRTKSISPSGNTSIGHRPSGAQYRWAVVGTGSVAAAFVTDLAQVPGAVLTAVGSRTMQRAREFLESINPDQAQKATPYGSYEDVIKYGAADVIYIATTAESHHRLMLLALDAGCAVLCEKPFTLNGAQALEVIALAAERRILLMEAMRARFQPGWLELMRRLRAGDIGEIHSVDARSGLILTDTTHRLYDPAHGGGSLLDIGVYPVTVACTVLGGAPRTVAAFSSWSGGIDLSTAAVCQWSSGATATINSSIQAGIQESATISGSAGRIDLHAPINRPSALTIHGDNHNPSPTHVAAQPLSPFTYGYGYQAIEVQKCLDAGATESDLVPLADSAAVMTTLTAIARSAHTGSFIELAVTS